MIKIDENQKTDNINVNIDLHSQAKEMVMSELDKNGFISKMHAQIKSQVLKVLEKQKKTVKQSLEFDYLTPLAKQNKPKEVLLAYHLIREFMQYFEMEYTLPVFEKEANVNEKEIKRDFLINELSLHKDARDIETRPVLVQLLMTYMQDLHNKKDNYSQKLDESYGTKNHNYTPDITFKHNTNDEETRKSLTHDLAGIVSSISNVPGKKQLMPLNFTNKSMEIKDNSSPSSGNENDSHFKFNTANMAEIYSTGSKTNTDNKNSNSSITNQQMNNEKTENDKDNKENTNHPDHSPDDNNAKFTYNMDGYNTNKKYDDEFNEVILEEIDENDKVLIHNNNEEKDDSRKSLGESSNMVSLGYDNSVTNYKLESFDYVEEVEKLA